MATVSSQKSVLETSPERAIYLALNSNLDKLMKIHHPPSVFPQLI